MSAIHAARLLYSRDSVHFDSTMVYPFDDLGIEVKETKGMHGLYGKLSLSAPLWNKVDLKACFLTGVSVIPDGECGVYVPDNGVTLTIADDCIFSSPLCIPSGHYRRWNFGRNSLDSLKVLQSSQEMPELSDSAKVFLLRSWFGEPEEFVLRGNSVAPDTVIWAHRVIVDSTFRGRAQVFARDSAVVMNGAVMEYPSGVCLVSDSEDSGVRIATNAVVEGYVAILDKGAYEQSAGSIVRGLLFVPGEAIMDGSVTGAAYIGKPCTKDGQYVKAEYTLAHFVQNRNVIYSYPEIFDKNSKRTVIREMDVCSR